MGNTFPIEKAPTDSAKKSTGEGGTSNLKACVTKKPEPSFGGVFLSFKFFIFLKKLGLERFIIDLP